ncbi:hypothetical protein C4561_01355 [candidate division WWE3 bacterium]|uniref:Uncharacterized protein n=1 Tax=candidate division WWE3 bacterium TaxID=2053526 RepID=A0A3A4ZF02_UNCKA|nr:MAG: hypothetical protein C4561_01355 [candidate division WWE3 bacterium]
MKAIKMIKVKSKEKIWEKATGHPNLLHFPVICQQVASPCDYISRLSPKRRWDDYYTSEIFYKWWYAECGVHYLLTCWYYERDENHKHDFTGVLYRLGSAGELTGVVARSHFNLVSLAPPSVVRKYPVIFVTAGSHTPTGLLDSIDSSRGVCYVQPEFKLTRMDINFMKNWKRLDIKEPVTPPWNWFDPEIDKWIRRKWVLVDGSKISTCGLMFTNPAKLFALVDGYERGK